MPTRYSVVAQYHDELNKAIASIDVTALQDIITQLMLVKDRHGTVYVAGNGGSSANASHMACHLMDAGIKAMCLTDNAPLLTSLANDHDYQSVFVKQVERIWQDGDVICIFSCSGTSENVVTLANIIAFGDVWRAEPVLMFLGKADIYDRGARERVTHSIHVAAAHPGVVEDVHSAMIHMVKEALLVDSTT